MIVLDLEVFSQWTEDVVGLFESFWRGYAGHVLAISESFRTPPKTVLFDARESKFA